MVDNDCLVPVGRNHTAASQGANYPALVGLQTALALGANT